MKLLQTLLHWLHPRPVALQPFHFSPEIDGCRRIPTLRRLPTNPSYLE